MTGSTSIEQTHSTSWSALLFILLGTVACGGSPTENGGGGTGGSGGSGGSGGEGPPPPGWSTPTVVYERSSGDDVSGATVMINDSGEGYIVYQIFDKSSDTLAEQQYWGVRYDLADGWGSPVAVSELLACDPFYIGNNRRCHVRPKAGIASDGTVTLLLPKEAPSVVQITGDVVGDLEPVTFETPWDLWGLWLRRWGDVVVLPDDTVWVRSGLVGDETSRFAGGTWSAVETIPLARGHELAVSPSGDAIVIGDTDADGIGFTRYGAGWGPVQTLADEYYDRGLTGISVADGGWAVAVWVRLLTDGGREAVACIIEDGTCIAEQALGTSDGIFNMFPDAVIDADGRAHAIWIADVDADETGSSVMAQDYSPASGWGEAYVVIDGYPRSLGPTDVLLDNHAGGTRGAVECRTFPDEDGSTGIFILDDNTGPLVSWPHRLSEERELLDFAVSPNGRALVAAESKEPPGIWAAYFAP